MIVTTAVEVSLVPSPTSLPGAALPPFWSTPNQGFGPISKLLFAGVATIVAISPGVTEAMTTASVDAVPPLMSTEHQLRKFFTVSVAPALVPGLGAGALDTGAP